MKVLFVINALGEGGTETSTAEMLPLLAAHGVDATVAILRSRGAEGVEQSLRRTGFEIDVLHGGLRHQMTQLQTLVDRTQPSVVHSALYEANLASRLALRRRTPLLTSLVNTSYSPERFAVAGGASWKLRAAQMADLITAPLTSHFHAVSHAVAADARRHLRIGAHRISVVHRGRSDLRSRTLPGAGDEIRRELGIRTQDPVLVNVGRQEPQKDHLTLLHAVEPLLATRPDLHLVIAGREGTASAQIEELLRRIDHADRVHLLGHRSDVGAILDAATIFVFPTRYEGLPGAVVEAMSMGLPIVASDIAPVRETSPAAALAQPGDHQSMRRSIEALLDDHVAAAAQSSANRARYEDAFTIGGSVARMADLYRHLAH